MAETPNATFVETTVGPIGRIIGFIEALKMVDGGISLGYRIGMKVETMEPAIGVSINGGEPHSFTVTEARSLADICDQTLAEGHEGDPYSELLIDTIKGLTSDLRFAADAADEKHGTVLKAFMPEH